MLLSPSLVAGIRPPADSASPPPPPPPSSPDLAAALPRCFKNCLNRCNDSLPSPPPSDDDDDECINRCFNECKSTPPPPPPQQCGTLDRRTIHVLVAAAIIDIVCYTVACCLGLCNCCVKICSLD
ncbi:unnamed protein product [Linum trigynum]